MWHIRDVIARKRTKIKGVDVKYINAPQYEGLAIRDMLEFAAEHQGVMECFPIIEKETLKLPREYIANVSSLLWILGSTTST